MHLNDAVFSFGILNTDLKCSVSLEQNSLEPAHMKSSTCAKLLSLSIYCFVSYVEYLVKCWYFDS